jgi:hypothetical protein
VHPGVQSDFGSKPIAFNGSEDKLQHPSELPVSGFEQQRPGPNRDSVSVLLPGHTKAVAASFRNLDWRRSFVNTSEWIRTAIGPVQKLALILQSLIANP